MSNTIPTSHGDLTIDKIMDKVQYEAYAANRAAGVSHEILVKWGIGDERMRDQYESKLN
jgi:hypothetical protein